MKKRVLSILLALLMVMTIVPTAAFAAEGSESTQIADEATLIAALANGGVITLDGDIVVNTALTVTKDATINGNGHTLTRGAELAGNMIAVNGDVTMYLSNVTLDGNKANVTGAGQLVDLKAGAKAVLDQVTCQNNDAAGNGGAIYAHDGATLIVTNSFFAGNAANVTEKGDDGNGGAIYVNDASAFVKGGVINGNIAQKGGAVYATGGIVNIDGTQVIGNSTISNGGAFGAYTNSTVQLNDVLVKDNVSGGHGGAAIVYSSTMTAFNSEFNGNHSTGADNTGHGGAVYCSNASGASGGFFKAYDTRFVGNYVEGATSNGGALYFTSNNATSGGTLQNCTFTGNSSPYFGGAIYAYITKDTTGITVVDLYDIIATNNSAGTGGYLYFTTTNTTLNMSGLTLSGNTATTSPKMHSNTTATKMNVAGKVLDDGNEVEWSSVIANKPPKAANVGTLSSVPAAPASPFIASGSIADIADQEYTGEALTPAVEVTFNGAVADAANYDVIYSQNTDAGTAKVLVLGKNGYVGALTKEFAIKNYVAQIGEAKYETLAEAIAAAQDGATIKLLSDVELTARVDIDKAITLDLDGHTISYVGATALKSGIIAVKRGGDLTIDGNGQIISGENAYAAVTMTAKGETETGAVAKLTVNSGKLEGWYYAITGNGNRHDTEIVINGGIFVNSNPAEGTAIYHPQNGVLTINGGIFTGVETAIEMRSGALTINDGTFTATTEDFSVAANGDGTSIKGAAIAVSQHSTNNPLTATINGGTFDGVKAVCEADLQDDNHVGINMAISGGTFNGDVESADVDSFISGGTFTSDVSEYCADGFAVIMDEEGNYIAATEAEAIKDLKDQIAELNKQIGNLEAATEDLNIAIDDLNDQKEELNDQITSLTTDKTALQTQVDTLTADKTALQTQVDTLTADKTVLQSQITDLTAQATALQTQVDTLTNEKGNLSAQIAELTAAKDQLTAQVADLTAKNTELQTKADNVAAQADDLTAQVADLQAQIEALKAENADTKDKADKAAADYEAQIAALKAENEQLKKANDDLTKENAQLKADNTALNDKVAKLESDAESLNAQVADLQTQMSAVNAQVADQNSEIKKLQTKNDLLANTIKLKKTVSGTKVTVSWNAIDGAKYKLTVKSASGTKTYTLSGTSKTFTVTRGKNYTYTVKAYKTVDGEKVYGNAKSVTVKVAPAKVARPTVTTPKAKTIKIAWNKTSGASYYQVSVSSHKTGTYYKTKKTTKRTFTVSKLTKGKTYYVKVRAVGANGVKGAWSTAKAIKVK